MLSTVLSWLVFSCGILAGVGVALAFVFHIDAFGWNRIQPCIFRERMPPLGQDERVLFQENGVSGAFDDVRHFYKGILQVVLTDARLTIRFVSSRKGLCLRSVSLQNIQKAELVEGRALSTFKALVVHFGADASPKFFSLISRNHLDEWVSAFGEAGLNVVGGRR